MWSYSRACGVTVGHGAQMEHMVDVILLDVYVSYYAYLYNLFIILINININININNINNN